jgi:hypothetical protein
VLEVDRTRYVGIHSQEANQRGAWAAMTFFL